MRLFKEEQVKEIFNDATIITTKKYFYYVSNEERMAHKIKMATQGFSDWRCGGIGSWLSD